MYSFSYLEPVCCSMSSSNCGLLTCIQISQETDQVVWYSHLFQNFLQFIVIHTVKGFGIVNKAEIDVFLELSYFFWWSSRCWNLKVDLCNYSSLQEYILSKDRYSQGFPDGSSGKEPTCIAGDTEDMVRSLSQEDPLEKGKATHSSILTWRIPRTV